MRYQFTSAGRQVAIHSAVVMGSCTYGYNTILPITSDFSRRVDEGRTWWLEAQRLKVDYLTSVFKQLTSEGIDAFQATFLAFQRILNQADLKKDIA